MKKRLKQAYLCVRVVHSEVRQLCAAWQMFLVDHYYEMKARQRVIFFFLLAVIGLSGVVLWRIANTAVYAQSETTVQQGVFYFPLQRLVTFLVRGGVVGCLIGFLRKHYYFFKRIFDIVISIVSLVVFSPLFIIIALLIKIDSSGPVFFRQARVGKDGTLFNIWKFRTMRYNAELETGPVWARQKDPRTTRIGNFLRKSHLDEIPQLLNIIRGDMSLIGPRPERPELMEEINKHVPEFHRRLTVKPGLTGLAQVRYSYGASMKDAARKLKFDLLYINRSCWFLDVAIIFWTMGRVLTGEGAR